MTIDLFYAKSLQGDGRGNEDIYGFTPKAAWVMDGATGLGGQPETELSDAQRYVSLFSTALQEIFAAGNPPDTREVLRAAIAKTASAWQREIVGRSRTPCPPSATLVLLRDFGPTYELTCLGDSRALLHGNNGVVETFGSSPVETLDVALIEDARQIRRLAPERSLSEIRTALSATIAANRARMNTPGGYWILSFDPDAANHAQLATFRKPHTGTVEIALATDGFLRLIEEFDAIGYEDVLVASEKQLDTYFELLRTLEANDPEGLHFLRLKRSDDATCIRCRIA